MVPPYEGSVVTCVLSGHPFQRTEHQPDLFDIPSCGQLTISGGNELSVPTRAQDFRLVGVRL